MIFIVHGNDYTKSRKLILNQQTKLGVASRIELNAEEITPKELIEAVSSIDLFGNYPFVVLHLGKLKEAEIKKYIDAIGKTPKETTLIILNEGNIGKSSSLIKNAKEWQAKVVENQKKAESNVFNFIDQLYSKNRKGAYIELAKLQDEDQDPFYIMSMLYYGLRNVTSAVFETEEFNKKSGFVKSKAQKQSKNFSKEDTIMLFEHFYNQDLALKTTGADPTIILTSCIEKVLE